MACAFPAQPNEQSVPSHQWLCENVYNYYFDNSSWHTDERHGPELSLSEMEIRQHNEQRLNMSATHFLSRGALESCRLHFLERFEKERAQAVARGHVYFRGTLAAEVPIGQGLFGQAPAIFEIFLFTFVCEFDGERWQEITGFPDVRVQVLMPPEEWESYQGESESEP